MSWIDLLWIAAPPSTKLFLMGLITITIISIVRFLRLRRRLSRQSSRLVSCEKVAQAEVDPYLLAVSALANQLPSETLAERYVCPDLPRERLDVEKARHLLRVADVTFTYLWDRSYSDVASTKRASLLVALLSGAMIPHSAYTMFRDNCQNENNAGYYCLLPIAEELTVRLAFGLFLCAMLYLGSSFFERKLSDRKTSWEYFCSRLKIEVSRE